jgi:predicted DNA-binding transcriptional regulator AlpA
VAESTNVAGAAVIDLQELVEQVGLSRATIYRLLRAGEGPPRVQLSARRFGYRVRDVERWLDAQAARTTP